ncbi:MAG: hypothetical protein QMC77_02765 [Methanocellales archaeon]|nr:hypothetical protein [Methanocellales archaeon]
MQYYVMKTGMEMFDACRAYGLGLVLDTLREDDEKEVIVSNVGIYYSVEGPEIDKSAVNRLMHLLDPNLAWKETFLTIQRSRRGDLKKATKNKIDKIGDTLRDDVDQILRKYEKPVPVEFSSSKGETLYQSMELAATKGYRVPIRSKVAYTEGSSIKVPAEDWALAALGEAHFTVWKGGVALATIIPQPEKVMVMHCRDIRNSIDQTNVNRVSTLTTLAHMAVLLMSEIRNRKRSGDPFIDKFSSLIYGAMRRTGGQLKPASGGIFPLDFLYNLMESDPEISGEIFEMWDHVFRIRNAKGRSLEDLSLSLSEFIAHPMMETQENYLKVHLRYLIKDDVKIRAYTEECIKEVMKNVRS